MRKPLATLAVSVAFILTAAVPSHAATPVSVADPAGDATAEVEGSAVSTDGLAAADLLGLDVHPAKKALTMTWTVANVDSFAEASSDDGWAATYNTSFAWKVAGKKHGIILSASNFMKGVRMFGDVTKETCKAAKVTYIATTVTAKVPYACVPGWKTGTKVSLMRASVYATASEQGLYFDESATHKGPVLK